MGFLKTLPPTFYYFHRLGARMELISRGILNESTSHVQSNIVIGSVTKIRLEENITCRVFFDNGVWSHPRGVYCGVNKRFKVSHLS